MLPFPSLFCQILLFSDVASNSVQLLQKLSITAVGKREKLLRVIKKPCFTIPTHWLPEDRLSHSSDKLMDIQDYANGISNDMNLVFVVGEMARGKIEKDYVEDYLSS
uniref:Nucleolar essential protein n=1 Tax=Solanum tuberosum TaxID=4113 RepID=M1CT13_SOLTU